MEPISFPPYFQTGTWSQRTRLTAHGPRSRKRPSRSRARSRCTWLRRTWKRKRKVIGRLCCLQIRRKPEIKGRGGGGRTAGETAERGWGGGVKQVALPSLLLIHWHQVTLVYSACVCVRVCVCVCVCVCRRAKAYVCDVPRCVFLAAISLCFWRGFRLRTGPKCVFACAYVWCQTGSRCSSFWLRGTILRTHMVCAINVYVCMSLCVCSI